MSNSIQASLLAMELIIIKDVADLDEKLSKFYYTYKKKLNYIIMNSNFGNFKDLNLNQLHGSNQIF